MVKKYNELQSIALAQRAYRSKYKNEKTPSNNTILNIVSVFEKTGSVAFMTHKNKDPREKRKVAKNELENLISKFPSLSIRKAATAVGVSPTLVFSILHDNLHLKPYKCRQWHKLEAHDYEKRVNFANWFLSLPMDTKYFFICSDEAYFYLTLAINKQNNRN